MSDNITLPREVVQEAVEALVEARALLYDGRKQDKAADALRTALAAEQPEQKPVEAIRFPDSYTDPILLHGHPQTRWDKP
jgi:hypothetical protein